MRGRADGTMQQGDPVTESKVLQASFYHPVKASSIFSLSNYKFVSELMYSEEEVPPTRLTPGKVKTLCRLPYQISKSQLAWHERSLHSATSKEHYRKINCRVDVLLRNTRLEFRLNWRGKEMGAIEAQYVEPEQDPTRWRGPLPDFEKAEKRGA